MNLEEHKHSGHNTRELGYIGNSSLTKERKVLGIMSAAGMCENGEGIQGHMSKGLTDSIHYKATYILVIFHMLCVLPS